MQQKEPRFTHFRAFFKYLGDRRQILLLKSTESKWMN